MSEGIRLLSIIGGVDTVEVSIDLDILVIEGGYGSIDYWFIGKGY